MFFTGVLIGFLGCVLIGVVTAAITTVILLTRPNAILRPTLAEKKGFVPEQDEFLGMYKAPDSCPNCKSIKIHFKLEPERPLIYYCIDCGWELNAKTGEVKESAKVTEEDNLIDQDHG
jgi:hypothetical protein